MAFAMESVNKKERHPEAKKPFTRNPMPMRSEQKERKTLFNIMMLHYSIFLCCMLLAKIDIYIISNKLVEFLPKAKRKSLLGNPFRHMMLGSNVIAPVSALVASLRSKTKAPDTKYILSQSCMS